MPTPLPARPNLDWLRKRAKTTLRLLRRRDPSLRLADAQLAVAREHGFSSWRALKAEIDGRSPAAAPPPDVQLVASFLRQVGAGDLASVRQLLEEHPGLANVVGPHPFWGGRPQPLHVAIETGRQPMFLLLLRSGADPNGRNEEYLHWSPLLLAIHGRREAMQRALLRRGARIGLVEALAKGDDRTVLRLLRRGGSALPEAVPNHGSLLMFARTPRAIDRLLELGVPIDARDHWGATSIEAMSRLGRAGRTLVRHLQAKGIRPQPAEFARLGDRAALQNLAKDDPDVLTTPAVMLGAVDSRHLALVRWLLSRGGTPQGWAETSIEVTGNEQCRAVAEWLARWVTSRPEPE